jgi:hypothetical protein
VIIDIRAALVLAGVLSVGFFPSIALTVLADHRREVPDD